MGLPEYNRVNWDETTTQVNPTNLNKMDQGIKDNNDYLQDLPAYRFQISGNNAAYSVWGGGDELSPDRGAVAHFIAINIPAGKKLVLRRARYLITPALDLRLAIKEKDDVYPIDSTDLDWVSTSNGGEETPDYEFSYSGVTNIDIVVYNSSDSSDRTPNRSSSWWFDFEIVDE